jgi:hypothetical protein
MLGPKRLPVVQALTRGIIDASKGDPLAIATFSQKINDRFDFGTPKETLFQVANDLSGRLKPALEERRTVCSTLSHLSAKCSRAVTRLTLFFL